MEACLIRLHNLEDLCAIVKSSAGIVWNGESSHAHHHWKRRKRKHCRLIYLVAAHWPPQGGKGVRATLLGFPRRGEQEERTQETVKQHSQGTSMGAPVYRHVCAVGQGAERELWGRPLTQILLLATDHHGQALGRNKAACRQTTYGNFPTCLLV